MNAHVLFYDIKRQNPQVKMHNRQFLTINSYDKMTVIILLV